MNGDDHTLLAPRRAPWPVAPRNPPSSDPMAGGAEIVERSGRFYHSRGASHPRPPDNEVSVGEPVDDPATTPPGPRPGLTMRQSQVISLLAHGLRYDQVAACLAISERQVQRHVSNAVRRMAVHNVNELVAVAVADGLVPRHAE